MCVLVSVRVPESACSIVRPFGCVVLMVRSGVLLNLVQVLLIMISVWLLSW